MVVASAAAGVAGAQTPAPPASVAQPAAPSPQRAFMSRYCASCHNSKLKNPAGSLALSDIDVDQIGEHAEVWERVVKKLKSRAMPPAGPNRARPDEASYE